MTESVSRLQELDRLYRFALLLCNDAVVAEQLLEQCIQEALKNTLSDPHRLLIWLIFNLRKRAFQKSKPSEGELRTGDLPFDAEFFTSSGLAADLHRVPEPDRSAYLLWQLHLLEAHDIAKLLGLTDDELSLRLQSARLHLYSPLPGNPDPAAV